MVRVRGVIRSLIPLLHPRGWIWIDGTWQPLAAKERLLREANPSFLKREVCLSSHKSLWGWEDNLPVRAEKKTENRQSTTKVNPFTPLNTVNLFQTEVTELYEKTLRPGSCYSEVTFYQSPKRSLVFARLNPRYVRIAGDSGSSWIQEWRLGELPWLSSG